MIHCENCDSPSVVVDLIDTESYDANGEGDYYYRDLLVYTCQDCGFSWEEFSEDYN